MNEVFLTEKAEKIVSRFIENGVTLSVAESCTGGWLSKILTDISGISSIYSGGICSYSNEIKMKFLGVKEETLSSFGAVSEQTAREMAHGVRNAMGTQIGVGITGIAGPASDNTEKPVGLIYVAVTDGNKTQVTELRNNFSENIRLNNRLSAIDTALNLLGGFNE